MAHERGSNKDTSNDEEVWTKKHNTFPKRKKKKLMLQEGCVRWEVAQARRGRRHAKTQARSGGGGEGSDETDVAMTHANNATGARMDPLLHAPPHTRTRERCARACHANMGRAHVRA